MKRVLTAAAGIPLVLGITYWSPPWLFGLVLALVAAVSLEEFFGLMTARGLDHPGRWFLLARCRRDVVVRQRSRVGSWLRWFLP